MQHHRGRQRHQHQEHADQDHPAGHAEQAGQERRPDHQGAERCDHEGRHEMSPA
jgi:hypothetical protein